MSSETKFGWELILDLYECDPTAISNEKTIRRYAKELCDLLDMKPYGEPMTPYFGENQLHTKGHSLVQFIETSSIVGHFSEYNRSVYINIFSCKAYDAEHAERFTKAFFGAKRAKSRFIVRE
jgi:S-adenosylmethionine decarboxylase